MSMDYLEVGYPGHRPSTSRLRQVPPTGGAERLEIVGAREQIEVPGRGALGVRLIGRGGPPVVLLHGWGATADINFGLLYPQLAYGWTVVAPDHRGHGVGIRSDEPFSLAACADDVAGLLRHLELGPATVLGYSMGGPIAMLLAREHPALVSGLVLCATAPYFATGKLQHAVLLGLGKVGRACHRLPRSVRTIGDRLPDVSPIAQAGGVLGRFRAEGWMGGLGVRTAVVVTTGDHLVPPEDQRQLAEGIPGASTFLVDGDHDVCVRHPRRFGTAVVQAIRAVSAPRLKRLDQELRKTA
ncbi:MAG TPA: alpha/beta hydrolase [Acidimicrobiales bacterium]|nr:alpha/beta hydrolase [Acidimicrobiales bacterium]